MKISACYPSKYLKAADLGDANVRLVIDRVTMEDVAQGEEQKPVLYFQNHEKGTVLNKTNSKVIAAAYGDDTDDWAGRPLILFSATVDFRGDMVEAIRVRIPKPPAAKPKADKISTGPLKPTPAEAIEEDTENPAPADDMSDEVPF
jgi:hypothetical protein